jgi:hypothetical protein
MTLRLASLAQGKARRILVAAWTAALVMIGGSSSVLACQMCFKAEESSMIDGARLGILVMLGFLFAVQGGFVGFFLYLRKRAKRNADIELDTEWAELQGVSRTS